jgi:CPA1 family monovalent cation:H+ antiporter
LAIPGGLLLGVAFGFAMGWISRFVGATLGGNLLQFLNTFLVWLLAAHLHLSAVLAVVACAMTVARATQSAGSPRMRVHSFAVWASVLFVLNVLAFLLMGMQARLIIEEMSPQRLREAAAVSALVVLAVVVTRFVVVMGWGRLAQRFASLRGGLSAPTLGQGIVVSWSGMRGLVTLATAFALPPAFPQRDLVVLAAFATVLATLVVQGVTLTPLIRLLKLNSLDDGADRLMEARKALAKAGLAQIETSGDAADLTLRELYQLKGAADAAPDATERLAGYRALGLELVAGQRQELQRLRDEQRIDVDGFYALQEEIDWRELTLLPEDQRRIDDV